MKRILFQLPTGSYCFLIGDIFSTGFYLIFGDVVTHFILKAIGTLIIGVLGGIAGLAGKDLYPMLKAHIKKILTKKKKTK